MSHHVLLSLECVWCSHAYWERAGVREEYQSLPLSTLIPWHRVPHWNRGCLSSKLPGSIYTCPCMCLNMYVCVYVLCAPRSYVSIFQHLKACLHGCGILGGQREVSRAVMSSVMFVTARKVCSRGMDRSFYTGTSDDIRCQLIILAILYNILVIKKKLNPNYIYRTI